MLHERADPEANAHLSRESLSRFGAHGRHCARVWRRRQQNQGIQKLPKIRTLLSATQIDQRINLGVITYCIDIALVKIMNIFLPDLVPEQARALASTRKRLCKQLPPGPHAAHDVPCLSIRIHGTRAHDGRILPSDGWILQLPLDATGCHEPKQQHSVSTAFQPRAHEASGDDAELYASFRTLPIYCHGNRLSDNIYRGSPSEHVTNVVPESRHDAVT